MSMSIEDSAVPREPRPFPNGCRSVFSQFSMKNRVVAVTGAADGIGLAVAEAMAEAGANLALWYNTNDAAVEKTAQLQAEFGVKATAYKVDVSDYTAVERTVEKIVSDFGKLDCFVANAGMAISKAITEQTIDEYKNQMSVNGTTP